MRKKLFIGNWKMNGTIKEAKEYFERFLTFLIGNNMQDRVIGIAPPFTSLYYVSSLLKGTNIVLCAQNAHFEEKGAYTGEISPVMLKELGVQYVILGHSERRHLFGESDELINKKIKGVLNHGLIPILCVGETLKEREEGTTFQRIEIQLKAGLTFERELLKNRLIIAYEPVWAIGTGKNATPEQAEEVHSFIRELLTDALGKEVAQEIPILYGGSVTPQNVEELIKMSNIDGVLVGGASLDPEKFYKICSVKF
ncbi:MAG: triose-phosphate isomerase [Caldimicrobium sp.]